MPSPIDIRRLRSGDIPAMRALNALFAVEFGDTDSYAAQPPADTYLRKTLDKDHVIVLAALEAGHVVGGLVAYELDKLERARSEIYLYDLAVASSRRRRGIATRLITALRAIARERDAWVVFVQADYGDDPAIALYQKLGIREEVLHFDLPIH
ncbi:MAG: AAC(3)-I family aminoglycoside N-acetyltransferase [Pigmentiphaga sp.]|uniref:AAC(3)-I family aminoglycoside N-acetyltransferase n=1 Tax=Pigmentiphaga sp. TaxID=1977564 RepID=UPI0029BCE0FE|nr:AAC(3)-I family aminoglycoside N-acetyltransferase [Pigmentiphaga sp.]MDX3905822.1 AAC(3)-I family aminoglycoside N-acetyltransferase [Pigmentiphaga sp.]